MEKQQRAFMHGNAIGVAQDKTQEEMRVMANCCKQHFHDLTRLRIERNRAARHARCASLHK